MQALHNIQACFVPFSCTFVCFLLLEYSPNPIFSLGVITGCAMDDEALRALGRRIQAD